MISSHVLSRDKNYSYQWEVCGSIAKFKLDKHPSGNPFIIDSKYLPLAQLFSWYENSGYLQANLFNTTIIQIHRLLLLIRYYKILVNELQELTWEEKGKLLISKKHAFSFTPWICDHADGNTWNNVDSNLRLSNSYESSQNKKKKSNALNPYLGVSEKSNKKGYRVQLTSYGYTFTIYTFTDLKMAVSVSDRIRGIMNKEFAVLNTFPESKITNKCMNYRVGSKYNCLYDYRDLGDLSEVIHKRIENELLPYFDDIKESKKNLIFRIDYYRNESGLKIRTNYAKF